MDREDLLLADFSCLLDAFCFRENAAVAEGTECPTIEELCGEVAKAQLDKVLKPEWKDKPDSEGWWWFRSDKMGKLYSAFVDSKENDALICDNWRAEWFKLDKLQGKWSKAIVPEKE